MLHTIFRPAMAIMSRLRFALKLGLIGVLVLAPLAGMTYFLDGQIKKDINFALVERLGVRQLLPARQLLQIMQSHRRTSQLMVAGDEEARQRLPAITVKVDAAFNRLGDASASGDAPIKMVEEFLRLSNLWREIRSNLYSYTAEEGLAKHNRLINDITIFLQIIADKSNLSFDPEMDSYYMVDAVSIHLPNVLNYLGQFRGQGFFELTRHAMTVDERVEINVLQNLFAKEFENLKNALDNATGANDTLRSAMQATRKEAEEAASYFLGAEALGLLKGDLTPVPAEFFERGTVAIAALYKLFDLSAQQLDGLLAARIEHSENNFYTILAGTGLVLLLVLYLFAGLLFSVLRSLRAIGAGAERLARGDLSRDVDSRSQDELRDVGAAVNTVITTVNKFTKAQLDMARAHNQDGSISATLDEAQFSGAYRDIARNLNEMVQAHIDVQIQLADLMVEYADGKFDSRMAKLPGEQQKISNAAEKVRAGLAAAAEACA